MNKQLINDLHIVSEVADEVSLRAEASKKFVGQMPAFFRSDQIFLLLLIVVHLIDIFYLIIITSELSEVIYRHKLGTLRFSSWPYWPVIIELEFLLLYYALFSLLLEPIDLPLDLFFLGIKLLLSFNGVFFAPREIRSTGILGFFLGIKF